MTAAIQPSIHRPPLSELTGCISASPSAHDSRNGSGTRKAMDDGPHPRSDVEIDQAHQFVKASKLEVDSPGSSRPEHSTSAEAMVAADMGLTESGEQKEGMPEDNAQSGRPVMNGSSVVGDSASAEMKVEGMERAGHEERPVEAPPAADGATAAVPMEMDDAPLPKQEDSMPSAETEVQAPPEAAAGQEGEGSGSEETMKVEPAAGEDSALPPPAELPSFLAPCLRGRLQVSPDGRHVCKGLWAMKRDDHNLEGDDLAKVTNKFEFSAMPSSPDVQLPMDGTYQGFFWITLKQLQKMEDTCQLQFTPNSAGGWNISGSGKNKCGTYQITGTVSAEKNLELFRLFDHLLKGKVPSSSKSKKSSSKKAPAPRPSIEQRAPPAFNLDGNSVTGSIDSTVSHLTVSTSLRRHESAALPPSPALSRSNTGVALASINVQGAALGVSKAGRVIKTRMPLGEPEDRARPDRLTNKCLEILRRLMTQPASYLFNEPVNPERDQCPDYYLVINTPMDFGSIKAKLEHLEYPSPDAFADDVRLVFQNAVRYNPRPEHFVNIAACQLSEIFENRFNSVFPSDYDVLDDDHVGMPTLGNGRPSNVRKSGGGGGGGGAKAGKKRQRPADLSYFEGEFMDEDLPIDDEIGLMEFDELPDTPGLVDLPHEPAKPPPIKKAKSGGFGRKSGGGGGARRPAPVAPADTQMTKALLQRIEALEKEVKAKNEPTYVLTYEDKKKLSKAIEQLPVEKASKVIQIIQKNMDLSVGSDEVEIDIDSLNNDTLLELQKYVNKCTQPRRSSGVPRPEGQKKKYGGDSDDDYSDDEY